MTARLTLEYAGAGFRGWATQPGQRTVQGVLEEALEHVRGEPTPVIVAGRTDAGVHARGQVASHTGVPAPTGALNAVLPPDVHVIASEEAPDGFDARRDARSRTYRYRLFIRREPSVFEHGRALHVPRAPARADLDACAALLPGTHDFTAFTPTDTHHVRFERDVFRAEWADAGEHTVEFWIEADTFMRHMVRTLVGTMLRFPPERFAPLLEGRPRSEGGDTAPAQGLYLEAVGY